MATFLAINNETTEESIPTLISRIMTFFVKVLTHLKSNIFKKIYLSSTE